MFNISQPRTESQKGAALVMVMLVLMTVTALGVVALRTASIETDIASNDKWFKKNWAATDGSCQMTTELIEQNIEDRGDWTAGPYGNPPVDVVTPNFYLNEESGVCIDNVPTKTNRDVQVPALGESSVYLKVYGNTRLSTGNALQIAAGDKGRGKGLAGGGAQIVFDIRGFGDGAGESQVRLLQRWRHLI